MSFKIIENNSAIPMQQIPVLNYEAFFEASSALLSREHCHCVNYYAVPESGGLRLICCIADDHTHKILVGSFIRSNDDTSAIESLTNRHFSMHIFEREIHERFGIEFSGHPWLKPVRFPFDKKDKNSHFGNYPFYSIKSHELHEVGVGPIHAGIIEPGHFRFICNGEKVLHLEIHLGFQHRGVESLMPIHKSLLQQTILAESIAGDTVAGHNTAFINAMEALAGITVSENIHISRTIACELERIAMHTADLSALCTDVAFQLGSAVLQSLRTIIINTFMIWCGNRFARKLLRCGYEPYPLTPDLVNKIRQNLDTFEKRYVEVMDKTMDMPSVLARFDNTGIVSREQSRMIGTVGMAARTTGIIRDIRISHPYSFYHQMTHETITLQGGDVKVRAKIRDLEVRQSLKYIREMLEKYDPVTNEDTFPVPVSLKPDMFVVSLAEGWRGEICHCAITGKDGLLAQYKIKDPSMHNWIALALAVRNNDISDFPVCNKSFNLSYCGYDL
ncbi:MAG TPA: NADH-quinone oxidoreductase subunit C [Bacteroidales bacterium]|nr:NADH-quinone oxidoreductase subunit C [Bacteroidales bacterium]